MARILILGANGAVAREAVNDLLDWTSHELILADLDPAPLKPVGETDARVEVIAVDARNGEELRAAMERADIALNSTYMRFAVPVTEAAIDAGIHLVDLGAYLETTLQQLELNAKARARGCRIVPGAGAGPGLTGVVAHHAATQLSRVDSVELYSHLNDPISMSPGIAITRYESSIGKATVLEDGRLIARQCFADSKVVEFAAPIGPVRLFYLPHPEAVTLPRYIDVRNVVYMLGYNDHEEQLLRSLMDLGFDSTAPVSVGGTEISPREFTATYLGRQGIPPDRETVNAKHIIVSGEADTGPTTITYDMEVRRTGESASAVIAGVCAAIGTALIAEEGPEGVVAAEGAFDPPAFIGALAERGITLTQTRRTTSLAS